jgi:hypothetical protein
MEQLSHYYNNTTTHTLDEVEEILTATLSDEALEAAADTERRALRTYLSALCSFGACCRVSPWR